MQEKAQECGLSFRTQSVADNRDLDMLPRDSYAEFLGGFWKIIRLGSRYVRWVQADPVSKAGSMVTGGKSGAVVSINERIDQSVFLRCQRFPNYRPASLLEWSQRCGYDLENVIANPEKHPEIWSAVTSRGILPSTLPIANR